MLNISQSKKAYKEEVNEKGRGRSWKCQLRNAGSLDLPVYLKSTTTTTESVTATMGLET